MLLPKTMRAALALSLFFSACGPSEEKEELDEELSFTSSEAGEVTALQNNSEATLSAPKSSMQLFSLAVPANATNLRIAIRGGTGDADLYVRFGTAPTTTSYDFRPYLGSSNEEVLPPQARGGTWFIGVRGYSDYSGVVLSVSFRVPGNELLLQNGGRYGDLTGDQGSELHFRATVPAGAARLRIAMSGGTGDADLHVRFGAAATSAAFDYRPYLSSNDEAVEVNAPSAGEWFVMVRGFRPYSGVSLVASWGSDAGAGEDEVLLLMNERRAQGANCGGNQRPPAPALRANELLRNSARAHSADMAARNFFDHTNPEGRTFDQRMRAAGYAGASPWGENIAAGQATARDVVDGWMNSPGHCENIMNPAFRVVGTGYVFAPNASYRHYWTQDFGGGD